MNRKQKAAHELAKLVSVIPPKTLEGNLDVEKFNELEETKAVIVALQKLKYKSSIKLANDGFVAAAMVLRF